MRIFAQHAYGKSEKIEKGLDEGSIEGVILSPKAEIPKNLDDFLGKLVMEYPSCIRIFDPQFYYSAVSPVKLGKLGKYSYFQSGLSRSAFLSPSNMVRYVQDVLKFQTERDLNYLVSPTVMFNSFEDTWSQVSLQMAQVSLEEHAKIKEAKPLLVSLVFSETALTETNSLDEFLNMASIFDTSEGFYIIVRRLDGGYKPQMDPDYLENLLYFIYSLANINQFKVFLGYTDFVGLPLHCLDISGTGCGWFATSRLFSKKTYEPQSGGSPPRSRYASTSLLNSILLFPEFESIRNAEMSDKVLSETPWDTYLEESLDEWPAAISCLHHWSTLKNVAYEIKQQNNVSSRLDLLLKKIAEAKELYELLKSEGVVFENPSGPAHLEQWKRAITGFRSRVNI